MPVKHYKKIVKYLLAPGPVRSRNDGDWHEITAAQLALLYGVPLDECIWPPSSTYCNLEYLDTLTLLRPRRDGDYRLPTPPGELPE